MTRRLGLDLGTSRIGVALSTDRLALPLTVISAGPRWIADVLALAESHAVTEIVVGWPVGMSGAPTALTKRIEAMSDQLAAATGLPVRRIDERLSTRTVERRAAEVGPASPSRRRSLDDLAAAEILQRFIDKEDRCDD